MIVRALALLAVVVTSLVALPVSPAAADDPDPIAVTLEPWASYDGVDRPYRYVLRIQPQGSEPVEVVADRRLLSFDVHPTSGRRRRRLRCRHPHTPRRVSDARVRTLQAGSGEDAVHEEWIDLRMYCWGRALAAVEAGARLEGRFGFRRRTRRLWVARSPESTWRDWTGRVELAPLERLPVSEPEAPTGEDSELAGRIAIGLRPRSVSRGSAMTLAVSVRAVEGSERVYVRPDAWSFRVSGPLGDVRCSMEGGGGSPAPDLYRRITRRSAARETLDAARFCPESTFELPGIYEVVPELRLEHSGSEYDLNALTGRLRGQRVALRVTSGNRGYLLQIPERADE